jgi:hypothetical protein
MKIEIDFIKLFRKLESAEFGFFVFAVCGSVCPGVLAIWLFDPELIAVSTTPKLVVLAVSFMLPYIALNSWIIGLNDGCAGGTPKNKIYIQLFLQAAVASMFMFCPCLAVRFLFGISLRTFLIILIILEFFFYVLQKGQQAKTQSQPPPNQQEQKNSEPEQPKV